MSSTTNLQDAYKAFQAGDFVRCSELLAPLISGDKADPTTLLIAAQSALKLGRNKDARALFARLAEAQPANRDTFLKMAADAMASEEAEDTVHASALPASFIDELLSKHPPADPLTAQIIALYRQGNFKSAAGEFDKHLAARTMADPALEIILMISHCNERIGNLEKAAHFLAHAALLPSVHQQRLLNALVPQLQRLLIEQNSIPEVGYEAAKRLLTLEPDNLQAAIYYRYTMQMTCAIEDLRAYNRQARAGLEANDPFFTKSEVLHSHLFWCGDEKLNARVDNSATVTPFTAESRQRRRQQPHTLSSKIRVGYLTADLYAEHPTSILFKGILAAHDPEKFEITLYCFTPGELKEADIAFRKTLPNLVVVKELGDEDAAQLIRSRGTDILIDLKGPTSGARPGIVNAGCAPVQAAWLGFPGSGRGIDCDYIISDPVVTPDTSKPYYHEKFCRLPESYQCNDGLTRPLPTALTKTDLGIDENTFLFASFNAMNKLSPNIIDLWAKILTRVSHSKLALFCPYDKQRQNFLTAMAKHGLSEERFTFLPRASYAQHLARIPAADLGLDCYPCNGHTTTSDMLWMGLPLLTFKGTHFASRVSESLLTAMNMKTLVSENADAFVECAVTLASDRETLAALRHEINGNRFRAPLFDTERFTRHLERAFELMLERYAAGHEPDHFDVPALPESEHPFR